MPSFCTDLNLYYCAETLQEVLRLIKAQAGAQTSPVLHYLLRFVLLFTPDAFGSSVRRLKALRLDMGRSFSSTVIVQERCAVMADAVQPCLHGPVRHGQHGPALIY